MAQLWDCSFLVLACLRQCLPISGVRSVVCTTSVQRETTVVSLANWLPPNNVKPSAMTSKRRASLLWKGVMSKSRSITFVDTLAPPSLQICAMAFSAANPLLPSTPTVLHTARWWPKASSGRPHQQVQTVKGRGKQRRRNKRTRYGSESILDTRWTGNAVNGTEARGPPCDLTRARWSGDSSGQSTWSRWCSWTAWAAYFCHPCDSPDTAHVRHHLFEAATLQQVLPMAEC